MKEEIYDPAFGKEALKAMRSDDVAKKIAGVTPPGVSRLKTWPLFDLDRVERLMEGAIDIHVHAGPDPYMARIGDTIDLAMAACQAGMGGICFGEPHHISTGPTALLTQKVVNQWADEHGKKRLDVFGGVSLNYAVGGLNPAAVVVSARIGAKVVWPPGVDSKHFRKLLGLPDGIDILDENDNVVPAMKEILELIAEGDLVLNMSNTGVKEVFCLIDEAKKAGVERLNVVHPNSYTTLMTIDQRKIAADKGASIELSCVTLKEPQFSWDDFMKTYNLVGPDRLIASSDNGGFEYLTPVVAMRAFITGMLIRDIPDKDVEKMIKTNPRELFY